MNSRQAIETSFQLADTVVNPYLDDLSDDELLARSIDGTNHIAWQLGHLIAGEHEMVEAYKPGSMPKLPAGFAEKHNKDTAASNDKSKFLSKKEYQKVAAEQRAGTLKVLKTVSDDELDKPAPESMQSYCPTVAAVFAMQPVHWMMHAGQWAVIRRKLGRKPLF